MHLLAKCVTNILAGFVFMSHENFLENKLSAGKLKVLKLGICNVFCDQMV